MYRSCKVDCIQWVAYYISRGKSSEDTVGEFGNAYGPVVNSVMKRLRALSAALYPVACLPNFSSNKMRSRKASSTSSSLPRQL